MKDTDVRVGNWINERGQPKKVNIPTLAYIGREPNIYEPFPLDESILLKAGFEKVPTNLRRDRGNFICPNKLMAIQYLKDCYFYDGKLSDIEIKSVHQLMNLYFALTNQELTIEL